MLTATLNVENGILKCIIIPVIIETTAIITTVFKKNLEAILGKQSVDSLQKQLSLEHHT
jgi:hypothetical protein